MKLYTALSDKSPQTLTSKELMSILKQCGCEMNFFPYKSNPQFINFVFYFVYAYSFESSVMDTSTYTESLKLIEKKFDFDFEKFKTSYDKNFDENYSVLIAFYLEVQKNRTFELIMSGNILYKQMLHAASLKGDDYKTKKEYFNFCLDLHKDIQELEATVSQGINTINTANPGKIIKPIRTEEVDVKKKTDA